MNPDNQKVNKHSRKHLLIYPKFQLLLVAINLMLSIGIFLVTLFQTSRSFAKFEEIGHAIKLTEDHPYFKLIQFQETNLYSHLILSFCFAVLIASFGTLVISHRLAGPLVRVKSYFKEISAEKKVKGPLKFREGDFFSDLPPAINEALQSLEEKSNH